MTRKDRIKLAICILLHIYIVWNLYHADQLTPRVVNIGGSFSCEPVTSI